MSQRRSGKKSLTQNENFVTDPEEAVNNVVRYIIYRGGEHMMLSKTELIHDVIIKPGGMFEEIMNKAGRILEKVYGYRIMVCDNTKGKNKQYVISNILPPIADPSETEEIPEDKQRFLLLLILSHIFMSNNNVTDVSLYTFLKYSGIDVDLKHPTFGQVKEYINKMLVKQHYLDTEVDGLSRKQTFKWGTRAETEISKHKILEFVCKIYKDKKPKDWNSQYQKAIEQSYDNPSGHVTLET